MALSVEQQKDFIEHIAPLVQKYAPQYGILVCSPIIAQACLESAYGTSDKVSKNKEWRHNYFGLKWRNKRCDISNEYFEEVTSEQNPDGSYYTKVDRFCKFKSLEDCVIGYFQWTNIPNYSNLKGVTDPRTYLENIKADKYATSLNYVQNNMNVIAKWNLTQYDNVKNTNVGDKSMKINVHAGHNPDGMKACGAVGIIKESTEARKVKDNLIKYLTAQGHTVYDCTVDDGTSQSDVLTKIVNKCNAHTVDIDVSIHFNAGAKDLFGNKKTTGVEVLVYDVKNSQIATRIANRVSDLGFTNRGVKSRKDLYVLKKTKAPALLVECCFVDDKDDCDIYDANKMAKAIAEGILNKSLSTTKVPTQPSTTVTDTTSSAVGTNKDCPFIITCLDYLNIRSTPGGTVTHPNGCKKGVKYTITKTEGSWGYLKSGRGWVTIDSKYVKRV